MANFAAKIINFNFSYLIVSVRRPSHTCASFFFFFSFFCQCLSPDFFVSATVAHDFPADGVFSYYPRCSVSSVCCSVRCMCICVCVRVCVCVSVYVYVYMCMFMYMYMCMYMCMYMYECLYVCLYVCVECVWKDGERTVSRAKSGETLVEASRDTKAHIVRYTFFHGSERQIEPSHGWFPPTFHHNITVA